MLVLFRAVLLVLLVLLVLGSDAAPGCGLPAKMPTEDLKKLTAWRWVLVEAFTDHEEGLQLLIPANSSVVEMHLNADGESFLLVERNILMGKCLTFYINVTATDYVTSNYSLHVDIPGVADFDGNVTAYTDPGRVTIFQTCPYCVTMIYYTLYEGRTGRTLLIYRQEGKHLNAEELKGAQVENHKTAECLKFIVPSSFKYDGTAEFCEEKKKKEEAKA